MGSFIPMGKQKTGVPERAGAIGILSKSDFFRLKCQRPLLSFPDQYDDWLDEREGLLIGLTAAGVCAVQVAVDLAAFLAWCNAERAAVDEIALDRFATMILGDRERRDIMVGPQFRPMTAEIFFGRLH